MTLNQEQQPDRDASRKLRMQYAGGMIKHLGLQMYGGAVPAIAELIANSWDADAAQVDVTLPLGQKIGPDSKIEVLDDGRGMTFEEINEAYLVLGRDRRSSGPVESLGGRHVMGRKGIGKLAGFGIAHTMRVETKKNKQLTIFEMKFDDMTHSDTFVADYEPLVLHDGADIDGVISGEQGTRVLLTDLHLRNAINEDSFRSSMARRFSTFGGDFRVAVNEKVIEKTDFQFQFRFPETGLLEENVRSIGNVKWWVGFTERPIPQDEARGISVLVHGKMAQTPFFFDLSKGTSGQLGMQYMTGEVHADDLDEEEDLISTDRASVRWEHERSQYLLEWGRERVRAYLEDWAKLRRERNARIVFDRIRSRVPHLDRIRKFPDAQQRELLAAVEKISAVETISDDRLLVIVDFLLRAYEGDYLFDLISQIDAADEKSLELLQSVIKEWDILEAVSVAQIVRGRIAVINKFRHLIESHAKELPDMHEFIERHPWALRPEWAPLARERSLERIINEHLDPQRKRRKSPRRDQRRPDILCMATPGMVLAVELKRPGKLVGRDELRQIEDYVDVLRQNANDTTDPGKARAVSGFLVYGRMQPGNDEMISRLRRDGMYIETWDSLLNTAERLHHEFLDVMKARGNPEDPRISRLDSTSEEEP